MNRPYISPAFGPALAGSSCILDAAVECVGRLSPRLLATPAPRLLDRVRQSIRARHYSPRTEKAYASNGSHDRRILDVGRPVRRILLDIPTDAMHFVLVTDDAFIVAALPETPVKGRPAQPSDADDVSACRNGLEPLHNV